ncbi:hypothetical protein L0U85_00895 [Glycomyces sp. L485]|uniref:hypothetical protein n=1 Tax=Glycomyces sp. L485 TaxID=2909235 RepID=UPI001F4B6D1D|nr:hypothetical protein [Glycomyces sp. L485]MCH7229424.1 hypothetical protein [Glycomyces sp. L485]
MLLADTVFDTADDPEDDLAADPGSAQNDDTADPAPAVDEECVDYEEYGVFDATTVIMAAEMTADEAVDDLAPPGPFGIGQPQQVHDPLLAQPLDERSGVTLPLTGCCRPLQRRRPIPGTRPGRGIIGTVGTLSWRPIRCCGWEHGLGVNAVLEVIVPGLGDLGLPSATAPADRDQPARLQRPGGVPKPHRSITAEVIATTDETENLELMFVQRTSALHLRSS